ncbi:hypothetical protein ASPZODRAFT_132318 [Penicilliopsis zonata CBS 506.65]|uniref:Methyltransferase type 11 domain-containing protein n=1 Tax=Penicilliopsis zonata CBS 506.65 TaxID=1073090 RepID=A0A1L9SJQ0_9EURO|nr:hypothetical protein ASPZODRAFT_132318 [Penicilliopsis zonata CBS 506.65]OJJ47323.1 hypothetical protein ASPZODRAFT_132318 [Penicilliopsis zonata CBS 506.65]
MTQLDPTFRSYDCAQAARYAKARLSYPAELYQVVLDHHQATGGQFDTVLDVGCGPGNATRDLALSFDKAIGVDPGEQMIEAAKELGGTTQTGSPIRFHVASAEDLARDTTSIWDIQGGVDLLTAAMAAHWFNMPEFWRAAERVVKPGGTVVLWTQASLYCHPSTPNADKVQEALSHLEDVVLKPYVLPSNQLSHDLYDSLPLPWTVEPVVSAFKESDFVRREWDRDGILTNGQDYAFGSDETSISRLERGLGTASMVTRWREAHPELANTDQDCVAVTMRQVREALGNTEADATFRTGQATVILLFKRQ